MTHTQTQPDSESAGVVTGYSVSDHDPYATWLLMRYRSPPPGHGFVGHGQRTGVIAAGVIVHGQRTGVIAAGVIVHGQRTGVIAAGVIVHGQRTGVIAAGVIVHGQ